MLSQAALGRALGLSPAAITKLKGQGMPVHSVEAAQAWREQRQNVAARKPLPAGVTVAPAPARAPVPPPAAEPIDAGEIPNFQASRARREAADADLAELKVRKERGLLVEAAAVRAEFSRQMAAVREGLLNIPARLAPVVAAESNLGKVQTLIDAELRAVLAQLIEGNT